MKNTWLSPIGGISKKNQIALARIEAATRYKKTACRIHRELVNWRSLWDSAHLVFDQSFEVASQIRPISGGKKTLLMILKLSSKLSNEKVSNLPCNSSCYFVLSLKFFILWYVIGRPLHHIVSQRDAQNDAISGDYFGHNLRPKNWRLHVFDCQDKTFFRWAPSHRWFRQWHNGRFVNVEKVQVQIRISDRVPWKQKSGQ